MVAHFPNSSSINISSRLVEGEAPATDEAKKSNHVLRKLEKRRKDRTLDPHIEEQFGSGRLLACVSSPPGHCGRADGYILEKELEFYMKKIQGKKGRGADVA
ncbi:hypothetical protein CICLE_v10003302mg [Citrus x clementina]|uniref:40S ribosomal protein S8 n=2 Tax=Citrus TaxID=2706 RepID=V4T6M7_CITCL|nr:40S ribosomal protein S8 [Citrus x clementina]ESR45171.1 hypothetical protein CICLE_v10003302mg [Citrus x clementina]GAY60823.1 hypothetical protein CUMW_205120 [Citrus unshiu]